MRPATTVLLVDDEVLITEMLTDVLIDNGFGVVVANDAAEALAAIAATPSIAMLVTDVNMGTGDDGWTVARRAREALPALAVIYTTGGASHEFIEHAVPGSVLLAKPFAVGQLVSAVSLLLTGPPPAE